MVHFVRTPNFQAKIVGLSSTQGSKFDVESTQVSASDLLIQGFGQHAGKAEHILVISPETKNGKTKDLLNTNRVRFVISPESNLGKDLVREGTRHYERRVTMGTAEVNQTAIGEEDDVSAAGHGISVNLRLDINVLLSSLLEPCDINFYIEMTDVADNGILSHYAEVIASDDISATRRRHEDIALRSGFLHRCYFKTSHCSLESIDGIDLSDNYTRAIRPERFGTLHHSEVLALE